MAVHRIDDNAEALLRRLAAAEDKKPSEFLGDLIRDCARGLAFEPQVEPAEDGGGARELRLGDEETVMLTSPGRRRPEAG